MENRTLTTNQIVKLLPKECFYLMALHLTPENIHSLFRLFKNISDAIDNKDLNPLWEYKRQIHFPNRSYNTLPTAPSFHQQFKKLYLEEYSNVEEQFRFYFSMAKEKEYADQWQQIEISDVNFFNAICDTNKNCLNNYLQISMDQKTKDHFFYSSKQAFAASNGHLKDTRKIYTKSRISDNTILYYALSYQQSFSSIQELMRKGSHIHEVYYSGLKVTHIAAESGHIDLIDFILQNDLSRINDTDIYNQTPLMFACCHNQYKLVEFLFNKNTLRIDIAATHTNYPKYTALHFAALKGNSDIVELLLEKQTQFVPFSDAEIFDCFMLSIKNGWLNVVKKFLDFKPGLLNQVDSKNFTGLMQACMIGHEEIVTFLIRKEGIDLTIYTNDFFHHYARFCSAFDFAIYYGHANIIDILLSNINFETLKSNNPIIKTLISAFIFSAQCNQLEIVKIFLKHNASLLNQVDQFNQTALMYASSYKHKDIIAFLLEKDGINLTCCTIDKSAKNGWTALHHAANTGCDEIVDMLLAQSFSNLKIVIPTVKVSLKPVTQGKLELIEYISNCSSKGFENSLWGQTAKEKQATVQRLKNLVFFIGDRKEYEYHLIQFYCLDKDNLGGNLKKIFLKLETFLNDKVKYLQDSHQLNFPRNAKKDVSTFKLNL